MNTLFAETLKKLRTERGLSQIQLGKQMFVNNSTVARWENGSRLQEAIDHAKVNRVALAILDIELGTANGLDLCRAQLKKLRYPFSTGGADK